MTLSPEELARDVTTPSPETVEGAKEAAKREIATIDRIAPGYGDKTAYAILLAHVATLTAQLEALTDFSPTSEAINALPRGVRDVVTSLETKCDPSGDLRAVILARDEIEMLEARAEDLAASLAAERKRADEAEAAKDIAVLALAMCCEGKAAAEAKLREAIDAQEVINDALEAAEALIAEMREAAHEGQKVLALITSDQRATVSPMQAWAQCVAAELKLRTAAAPSATGGGAVAHPAPKEE